MVAAAKSYPRTFVPNDIDLADFDQLRPLFENLQNREIHSPAELESWLGDFSELSSVVDEFGSRRYIDHSCHTDDADVEKRFMQFVEVIEPQTKPLVFELQKKFLMSPHRAALTDKKYVILSRQWQADVDVFRDVNVPLETEATKLVAEYDKLCGAQMVTFRGKEYTMQQLAKFGEDPDRAAREEAFRVATTRRLADRAQCDDIFDKLLDRRAQIAANAGFDNYRSFIWKQLKRFDYTPDDCLKFGEAIADACVPLVRELDRERAKSLGVETLRPWDLNVDPKNRPALTPFDAGNIDDFVTRTRKVFERLSDELAEQFESMRTNGNLDLDSRKGKQNGGYQSTLNEVRQPFIFMNAAGVQRDVETLLHEGGHAFHAIAAKDEPLTFLRHAPMEFCEVASMAMELLAGDHLDVFYNKDDHARALRVHLEGIIRFFPWMATIDGYQHWLYTHPNHTREQREAFWLQLMNRFGSQTDWSGFEDAKASRWQQQLHLYHVPFYYVEYGIAQLGALQLWMKAQEDPKRALANYRAGLALGGTRALPELFSAAGIVFDFSAKTLKPLIAAVADELKQLPA